MNLALHVLLSLGFAGIITSVVLLRKTSPSATDSPENALISTISSLRSSVRTILAPPYIYLLLNFIIISIAASSSFLHRYFPHNHHNDAIHSDYIHHNDEFNASDPLIEEPVDSDANSSGSGESDLSIPVQFVEAEDKFDVNLDETWSAIADKNRNESRLRRSDGDVRSKLGQLVDDDDGDTLEALWKSIAEENKRKHSENQIPPLLSKADPTKPDDLSKAWDAMKAKGGGGGERRRKSDSTAAAAAPRRLRKSESTRPRGGVRKGEVKKETAAAEEEVTAGKELRKSETFNDAASARRRGGLLRRDPSLSVDELNGRVEAFIKNFNHQMRLQRQESEQRFLDMMKRGV